MKQKQAGKVGGIILCTEFRQASTGSQYLALLGKGKGGVGTWLRMSIPAMIGRVEFRAFTMQLSKYYILSSSNYMMVS